MVEADKWEWSADEWKLVCLSIVGLPASGGVIEEKEYGGRPIWVGASLGPLRRRPQPR